MRYATVAIVLLAACSVARRQPGNGGVDAASHPDAASPDASVPDGPMADAAARVLVYAHTSSDLYSIDPDTDAITHVAPFQFSSGTDQMTDIAIDSNGNMIGISFTSVYSVDPNTANANLLANNLGTTFNGLSFVPAAMVGQTGDDVLVATRNEDGAVFRIDPMTGATTQLGTMGGAYVSSGDVVAVDGLGTLQTVPGAMGDQLVQLAPQTFAATPIGTGTNYSTIWGVAYAKGKVYGFCSTGEFILIDPTTGAGTLVTSTPESWWGAAVTTVAPIIQ